MELDGITRIFGHRFVKDEDRVLHFTGRAEDYPNYQEESVSPDEQAEIEGRVDVKLVDTIRVGSNVVRFTIYPKGQLEKEFSRSDFDEFKIERTPKDWKTNDHTFNSKIVYEVESQVEKKGLTILR